MASDMFHTPKWTQSGWAVSVCRRALGLLGANTRRQLSPQRTSIGQSLLTPVNWPLICAPGKVRNSEGSSVDVQIVLAGATDAEELGALSEWLAGEPELRGRVVSRHASPVPGTLGPILEALLVAVGPGSTAAALGAALVSWVRGRRGQVSVIVTRPDGTTITLEAKRLRDLNTSALSAELNRIVAVLSEAERRTATETGPTAGPEPPAGPEPA
jgi:hypothetical protein